MASVLPPLRRTAPGEVLLDEAALAGFGHGFAHDLAGGGEGQVGDLGAQIRQGAVALGGDVGGGLVAQPLQLFASGGDVRVAQVLGRLLGRGDECLGLAPGIGDDPIAIGGGPVTVLAGLIGVGQPLLDAGLARGQDVRDRVGSRRPRSGPGRG